MLGSNHDNLKFKLTNLTAFVINNNSNVYIDKTTNLINDSTSNIATITINKGNTVNRKTVENSYDVVYGNSIVLSDNTNNNYSSHLTLLDYNFPAARYKINGYKTNYAILLNNGDKPFWTSIEKGILVGNIDVDKSSYIPTRMNGFTATIDVLDTSILYEKYNGTIVIGNIFEAFDANFVYHLVVNRHNAIRHNRSFKFSNIEHLQFNGINDTEIILKNVSNANLLTNSIITLHNSNISTTKLSNVKLLSYNTTLYLNINSYLYLNYILSGTSYAPINLEVNRNIFFNNSKYLHQTLHPFNSSEGYSSNLPIGSVVWWPEIWTGFSPTDTNRTVISRGDPNSYDWELCDGRTIPTDSLYTQIYGLSTTPNYRVDLKFYLNQPATVSGHHYLTLPSLFHSTPINVITGYPLQVKCAPLVNDFAEDNLHKAGILYLRQKLYGNYDLQLQVLANWRMHAWVTMQFEIDFNKLNTSWTDLKTGDQPLAILFDSYCCYGGGSDGNGWWNCWNGGYLTGNSKNLNGRMPSSIISGLLCLGGYPIKSVTKGNNWIDTRNTPKLALKLSDNSLFYIKCINEDPNDALRQFVNTLNKKLRASYDPVTYGSCKNIKLVTGAKGKSDGRYECQDIILTNKLPYLKKKYQLVLKPNAVRPANDILTAQVMFQIALPTTVGALRSKQSHASTGPRWPRIGNRDNTLNSAPYHQYWLAQYITVMNNVKLKYQGMSLNVIPNKQDSSTSKKKSWRWGYKSNTPGTKINVKKNNNIYYTNQGLFRRLNPYIKIDLGKGLREQIIETETDTKQDEVILDGVNVIKVRNDYLSLPIEKLNTQAILQNMLSSCYIPSDGWLTLKNNIVDFDYVIDRELLDKCIEQYEGWKVQYNNITSNQCNCNVYKDDDFTYILLIDKTPKNLFNFTTSIPITDIDEQDLANGTIDFSNVNLITYVTEDILPDVTMKPVSTDYGYVSKYYYKQQDITKVINASATFSANVDDVLTEIKYVDGNFVNAISEDVISSISNHLTYYYQDQTNVTDVIESEDETNYFTTYIDGIKRHIYYSKELSTYYYKITLSSSLLYTTINNLLKKIYYYNENGLSYYYYVDEATNTKKKIENIAELADLNNSALTAYINFQYKPVIYYNTDFIIDVTSSIINDLYYYYNEDITNVINGTYFTSGTGANIKNIYYDFLGNNFFTKNEDGVLLIADLKNKMKYMYNNTNISSIVYGNDTTSVNIDLDGTTISLKYLSAYGMYYYKPVKKLSANITNYIKDKLRYVWNSNNYDVTSAVNGKSFRYYDGDEWRDVYYDIYNNSYYYKNMLYNYEDYNTLINTLKKYCDGDPNSIDNQLLDEKDQIEYTYYSISSNAEDLLINIIPNSSLIQLASNYKKLENEIYYIQNLANGEYVVSNSRSIPLFFTYDDLNLNSIYDKKENSTLSENENIWDVWNDGLGITKYCLLGTNNQVMSTNVDLSTFQFRVEYNTYLSGLKAGTQISANINKIIKLTATSTKPVSSFITSGTPNLSCATVDGEQLTIDTIVLFDDLSETTLSDIYNSGMLTMPKKTSAAIIKTGVIRPNAMLSTFKVDNAVFPLVDGELYIFTGEVIGNNNTPATINNYVYRCMSGYVLDLSAHLMPASAITTISDLSAVEYINYFDTISGNRGGTLTPDSTHPLTGI